MKVSILIMNLGYPGLRYRIDDDSYKSEYDIPRNVQNKTVDCYCLKDGLLDILTK